MPQTLQHRRRVGTAGPPTSLLEGQFGINDPTVGGLPSLYVGTPTVKTLVSDTRQVEIIGAQTITGDKTIAVANLHITGGASGQVLATNGAGVLSWVVQGAGGGIADAPLIGGPFARQSGAWTDIFPIDSGTY